MSNNSKAKGAGLITFKPEIRRESIRAIIYMTISVGFAMCFLRLIRNIQICKSLAMSIVMTNMADVCGNVCQVVNINKCGMMRPTT